MLFIVFRDLLVSFVLELFIVRLLFLVSFIWMGILFKRDGFLEEKSKVFCCILLLFSVLVFSLSYLFNDLIKF